MTEQPIYLDHNASTPLLPEVVESMLPYLKDHFGNPSSTHSFGQANKKAVEDARIKVAELIGANPEEIIFTSGGSESNNLAIKGIAEQHDGGHIITSSIEHPAVLEVCRYLETKGYTVTYLEVDEFARVDPETVRKSLRPDTILITIMLANNEVGTIQPIRAIAEIAHQNNIVVHTDAAQAVGKIRVNIRDLGVDLMSVAGHKMNAPKGIGALYIRNGVHISPLIHGAGHEHGIRPGTENVLEIVGLGKAAELFRKNETGIISQLNKYGKQFWTGLKNALPNIDLNGSPDEKLPNTVNIYFPGIDANTLLDNLPQIAASAGAACHADSVEPSHVLKAMGFSNERILGSVRFSLGRTNRESEIQAAIEQISQAYKALTSHQLKEIKSLDSETPRLTQYTHGLGCACKIRPRNLEKILQNIRTLPSEFTQVGFESFDDAAVYRLNENLSIVSTVDFFTPIVDNPTDFGRIAAANSLSDIYAMGARPLFALNIAAFPEKRLPLSVLENILRGAREITEKAGIPIIGGHTIEDNEPKFGLAVTGRIHPEQIWHNSGALPGDALILTKPIGLGILSTALKRNLLDETAKQNIIAIMTELNSTAADIARNFDIHACTDVTGFGLLGHLWEMLKSDNIAAEIHFSSVPIIPGTEQMARRNSIPGGTDANLDFLLGKVSWSNRVTEIMKIILADAQTSGGLLFAVPETSADAFVEKLRQSGISAANQIGIIIKSEKPGIIIDN
ncbi:MAG: selenide, water dikinase SelD [Candidatus Marinimicrobia bacterium]|nr:selenide, water dikinase SelD [Candidatus Neomarinimicrobiota bacterium]